MKQTKHGKQEEKRLAALQQEVAQLKGVTLIAIEELEQKLSSLEDIPPVTEEDWSPSLDTVQVYSIEKRPPLSESIRQVFPAVL